MTTIATVAVDGQSAGDFLVRWPQPYEVGDDTLEWFVTTSIGTKQVQRDRLTDNVYTCHVLVAAGTTSFTVTTGADTSPATVWTAPSLDQLGIQFTGFEAGDKHIHKADFLDTTTQLIERDGHMERTIYRYMMTKVSHVGDATGISLTDGIACCHVWIHYRADNANILELEFDVSNSACEVETDPAKVASRGGGLKVETAPTTFGFLFCDPIVPTGWTLTYQDRPLVPTGSTLPATEAGYISNAHCLPKRMGTSRRWVLSKDTAGASAVTAAGEVGQLLGLGRAVYVSGQRSYHTVRAWGPTKSIIPDLATLYTGGYAAAKTLCDVRGAQLRGYATNGTAGTISTDPNGSLVAEFGLGPSATRMGLLHPAGSLQESTQGGEDIEVFCGARMHIREHVRHAMLYSSMKLDGSGVRLTERTSGSHLTNKHFTDAYNGGPIAGLANQTNVAGMRPFVFETDQNSGGEYRATRQQTFAGVIPRAQSWPPHFYAGTNIGNQDGRYWPEIPSNWGTPSKSIWAFQCNYRPLLEQIPVWGGAFLGGKPLYQGGIAGTYAHKEATPSVSQQGSVCWRDNEDDQHAIRLYAKLLPCIWNGCDHMARHQLKAVSSWYGWRWCESNTALNSTYDLGTGTFLYGDPIPDGYCLPRRLASQMQAPNAARVGMGRGAAWAGLYIAAAHYAVADDTERTLGYSQGRGLKSRAEQLFNLCRLAIITQNGMTAVGGFGGGVANPYAGQPDSAPGATIPFSYGIMQAGLELPKVYAGFWSLLKQLEADLPAASISHAKQLIMQGFNDYIARTNLYMGGTGERWPANYVATWTNKIGAGALPVTGLPVTGSDPNALILRGPPFEQVHWDDCSFIPEIAYRITGDASTLRVINSLATPNPPGTNPIVKAGTFLNQTSAYNPGLIAEVQRLMGAEGGVTLPPTNPTIHCTAEFNPAPIGSTVKFFATITKGANPTSTSVAVSIDFSALGIVDPVYAMLDDGVAPDVTAGDLIYTTEVDTTGTPPGRYSFPATVGDAQGRRQTVQVPFSLVNASTDPSIPAFSIQPASVEIENDFTLFVTVTSGTAPSSTGIVVTADLSSLGGSASTALADDGVSPDASSSDGTYSLAYTLPSTVIAGEYAFKVTVVDDQERMAIQTVTLTVYKLPEDPDPVDPPVDTSIIGYANSAPVLPGDTLTLTAIVSFGTNSTGASLAVTTDLTALAGDEGVSMDAVDDHTFTVDYDVPSDTEPGFYSISFEVNDAENGTTGTYSFTLEVAAPFVPTDPQIMASAAPNPVLTGAAVTFHGTVIGGTSPDSTGLVVTASIGALGPTGVASILTLVDTGVSPDVTADDLIFTANYTVSSFLNAGSYEVTLTVTDDQDRTASDTFTLFVIKPVVPPPIPNHPVPTMFDTLTHTTARISESSTGKIFRYLRDGANAPLLQANVDHLEVNVYWEAGSGPEVPIWTSGRLEPTAQNLDGTEIIKSAVVVDGNSPSRAGHTLELALSASEIGLKGDNSYRVRILIWLVEPAITVPITIPLACDEAYT